MPYGHRVGTHYVRTDPPVVSIDSNFIWSDVVRVILVRQFVHFTTYFHTATQFNHVLAELLITDEPVVNTQEMSCCITQCHDCLQEQIVLSLCVHLSCFAHLVALIHREFAQHGCFQTDYQVSLIDLKNQVIRANVFHRSHGNGTFHL